MARTVVYLDGFNLYYRALKGTLHKWLDVLAMSRATLPASARVERVNYYTARISSRVDPGAPARQHAYLTVEPYGHTGDYLVASEEHLERLRWIFLVFAAIVPALLLWPIRLLARHLTRRSSERLLRSTPVL